jgi:hypothetical protein
MSLPPYTSPAWFVAFAVAGLAGAVVGACLAVWG